MKIKCDKCKKIIAISNFDIPQYPKYVYRILCVGCGIDEKTEQEVKK